MIVRCRLHRGLRPLLPVYSPLSGCSDRFLAGPMHYVESDALTKDIKGKTNLAGKPKLQDKVRMALAKLFGDSPADPVPEGMGVLLDRGGAYLANYLSRRGGRRQNQADRRRGRRRLRRSDGSPAGMGSIAATACTATASPAPATARPPPFLYPTPRDYRQGMFKFTSTPNGSPAASRRPAPDDSRTACTAPRCRRSRR